MHSQQQPKRYSDSRHNFSRSRTDELAHPKERSERFVPDKPSPYWLDYIIDPVPSTIKDAKELLEYYRKLQSNLPRLEELSRPKTTIDVCLDPRPKTRSGVAISALKYQPSERIRQLAESRPFGQGERHHPLPDRKASQSSRSKSPTYRHPRYPSKKESNDSTKLEMGKGDFRSKYLDSSSSKGSTKISNHKLKPEPEPNRHQVHIQSHVTYARPNLPINPHKPLRPYAQSATEMGSESLQIQRSYASLRSNINLKRTGTGESPPSSAGSGRQGFGVPPRLTKSEHIL